VVIVRVTQTCARPTVSFAMEGFLLKFAYCGLFYVSASRFFLCSAFHPRYCCFSLFTIFNSLSIHREPETLCSWCKTPVGVRYYLGNRKASVLRRKWAFFSKFLRLQHPSSQYASLHLQYLSKISENAVPAHLRACLCYGPDCLLTMFLEWQSSHPSRPLSRPHFVQPVRKRAQCTSAEISIAIQLQMQLYNVF